MTSWRTVVVLATFALAACASADSNKAEIDAAMQPWTRCVMSAIARLDDGRSDPVSIAYGIQPSCATLYEELTRVFLKDTITVQAREVLRRKMHEMELQQITTAILTYRAAHPRR